MTTRAAAKSKSKKPLETTLGRAPLYSSDDPIDLSHVRKPIDTSIFGLSQVLRLFETATDEVRKYVAYECDIMYECRMCRTIFRSLANFILHKRNYCRESYSQNDHTNCRNSCQENEFAVMQEDADTCVKNSKKHSRESSPVPPKCDSKPKQVAEAVQPSDTDSDQSEPKDKKNLNSVLARLLNKQQSTLITEQCISEDISDESKSSEKEEMKNNVALQITETGSGVFQTMFRNMIQEHAKMDFMKTEVMEIHDILENNEVILGSDGKIVTSEAEKSAVLKNNFTCTICNQKFSTKKTLTYHINYKHNNTRLVYRCPECEDTFANAWCVFRHLYKIHRKTPAQVKRLRNQIHANKMSKDEQPVQKDGNSVKANSVQPMNLQGLDLENQQWMDDLEGDNDLQRCGGCGRKFERKAALHSHSQFCTKRIAVCNTIKENSSKRVPTEEKQERIIKNTRSTTNVENEVNGSRRRKPLVAQRLCRIDYVKENQNSCAKTIEVKSDSSAENTSDEVIKVETNDQVNNTVEATDKNKIKDCNGDEDASITNDSTKFKVDIDSCSDNLMLVDSVADVAANNTDTDVKEAIPADIQNSIITRSKSSAISDSLLGNGLISANVDKSTSNSEIVTSKPNDDVKPTESVQMIHDPVDKELENSGVQADSKILTTAVDENISSDTENAPQRSTIQIRCTYVQKTCPESAKRKMNTCEPDTLQPDNSKRLKDESSGKVLNNTVKTVPVSNSNIKTRSTLEVKSIKYINEEKHTCLPCNKTFKSHKSLIKHMAVHFNWYRYQCRSCQFMSFNRSRCDRHAEKNHAVHDEATLKNIVLHIPLWKTIELSTDFIKHCKKHTKVQNGKVNKSEDVSPLQPEKVEEAQKDGEQAAALAVQTSECSSTSALPATKDEKLPLPNTQDPSVRKMIMEVIFGSDISSITQPQVKDISESELVKILKNDNLSDIKSEKQESSDNQDVMIKDNSRPVRNRIAPVQKDFLYDMKQILKPKSSKEKETTSTDSLKEVSLVKKQKPLKVYMKKTKPKFKKTVQLTEISDEKSISNTPESNTVLNLTQDINMNSKDLTKTHVTGDCV